MILPSPYPLPGSNRHVSPLPFASPLPLCSLTRQERHTIRGKHVASSTISGSTTCSSAGPLVAQSQVPVHQSLVALLQKWRSLANPGDSGSAQMRCRPATSGRCYRRPRGWPVLVAAPCSLRAREEGETESERGREDRRPVSPVARDENGTGKSCPDRHRLPSKPTVDRLSGKTKK